MGYIGEISSEEKSGGDIVVEGIPVFIVRKKMKNMYIRIDQNDGHVKVSAPRRVSDREIGSFVQDHMDWIQKTKNKLGNTTKVHEFVTGETCYLWGEPYVLEVNESSYQGRNISIDSLNKKMIMLTENDSTVTSRAAILDNFYKSEMKRMVPDVLERCAEVVDKYPGEIRFRDMKTRWGTCNVRERRIWLNIQLAAHPRECLDYVMTHELTHLYVANHGPEFKAYMDRFYPDWKRVKKELNSMPPL